MAGVVRAKVLHEMSNKMRRETGPAQHPGAVRPVISQHGSKNWSVELNYEEGVRDGPTFFKEILWSRS